MNTDQIRALVSSQIGDAWDTTNRHGVALREALVQPHRITVIERLFNEGKTKDRFVDVWLVLVENHESGTGYQVIAVQDGSSFGLATEGFASDKHLVMCGWYGDFLTTFRAM